MVKTENEQYRAQFTEQWNNGVTYQKIADNLNIPLSLAISLRIQYNLPKRQNTRYTIAGKLLNVITETDFRNFIDNGLWKKPEHKAYAVLVYYSAVRREEARQVKVRNPRDPNLREIWIENGKIVFSVGKRLKHGIETPPLKIPTNLYGTEHLTQLITKAAPGDYVFTVKNKLISPRTCYNAMHRAGFGYGHHCRLSRITQFFLDGWTIPQIRSWTGLTLQALNFYLGLADIEKMGESLK